MRTKGTRGADALRQLGSAKKSTKATQEPSQDIEITSVLAPKKRPPNPSRFRFEKVNEVTWKLTNGEMTNVPASHGQWGGYRVTKAIGWIINVAPNAWLARCGDQTSNPLALTAAKSAAVAMALGTWGDYVVSESDSSPQQNIKARPA